MGIRREPYSRLREELRAPTTKNCQTNPKTGMICSQT